MTTSAVPEDLPGNESILDLIEGSPLGDLLDTPLPSTPLEALRSSPLGPVLETPIGNPLIPQLPSPPAPLPANPLEALLQGRSLPALPGVDELFAPLIDLVHTFGSGTFGSLNPTSILDRSSNLIDRAMSISTSGLTALDHLWQGQAARAAQAGGEQARACGCELSERGREISDTTRTAAASVARGQADLTTICESFAATAVAAAPVLTTPPGQAMLLASAAEHIRAAIGVVTRTRVELNEQTLTMNGLAAPVPVPPPPIPVPAGIQPSPFAIASTVLEGAAEPLISFALDGARDLISSGTHAMSASSTDLSPDSAATKATAATMPGSIPLQGSAVTTTGVGVGVDGSGGAGGGVSAGPLSRGTTGNTTLTAPPGNHTTGGSGYTTRSSASNTEGAVPHGTTGGATMMGAPRGGDEQASTRPTPSYLITALERTSIGGQLPMVAPAVIGGEEFEDDPFESRN